MGRGTPAARLIVAGLVALLATAAQVLPQRIADALDPAAADVLVGAGFAAAVVLVHQRVRPLPSVLLGGAALVWTAVGAAPLIDGPLEEPILRLALLPHALLVGLLASLPSGRLDDRHARVLCVVAVAVALVAGTGRLPFPLAAVGLVAVVSAVLARDPAIAAVRAGLGGLLVVVDLLGVTGLLPAAAAAGTVDIALLAATAVLPRLLDREAMLWAAAAEDGASIGSRLGRALVTGPLTIAVPLGDGTFVDPSGRRLPAPEAGMPVRSADGLLAVLAPPVRIDPALEPAVVRLLEHVAPIARGREHERRLAADLDGSRRLLIQAGDEERRDLTLRVSTVVGGRIGEVGARLAALGGVPSLVTRAGAARQELLRIGAAPGLSEPEAFAAALRELAGPHVEVQVSLPAQLPDRVARVLWYACSEGLANAAKHAAGACVRVAVIGEADAWAVSVDDDGPGGADLQGSGLRGLTDRAADLHGTVDVTSDAGGTRLTVRIPAYDASPEAAVVPVVLRGIPDPVSAAGT